MRYSKYEDVSNESLCAVIDNWIKGERNRAIMKRRLIDLITYERIAEEFDLSASHVKTIVYHGEDIIFKHL